MLMTEGYELLAVAILNRAVEDYRAIKRQYQRYMSDTERQYVERQLYDLEQFFLSEYGMLLSHGLGSQIVERLQNERI